MALTSFTAREQELLLNKWTQIADTLMNRDGNNTELNPDGTRKYKDGGHQIKGDPLLTQAIQDIRDQYFEIFNQGRSIQKDLALSQIEKEKRVQALDYDLINLSRTSYEKLQTPNYGLAESSIAECSQAESKLGLSKLDAGKIMGSIIKRSIDTFEITFKREKEVKRPAVPHTALKARPEQVGRTKPVPDNRSWGESVTPTPNQTKSIV